jgi:RNA polymerase sigma-70 factor (ECF subfamily)
MKSDHDRTQPGDRQTEPAGSSLSSPPFFFELYELSEGSEVSLDFAHFAEALLRIGRRFLPSDANDRQIIEFYENLHLKDLALAQACNRGRTVAWERFQSRYRDRLYSAALVIAKNDSLARELADSLSGDLFGSQEGTNEIPSSKLTSYTGRGSLEGWLKAVLANAYVDRYRSQRRVVSLDQRLAAIGTACLFQPAEQDRTVHYRTEPDSAARFFLAIEEACFHRKPEQRFLLAAYFCDGWNLAEIARRVGVHESTVSRRLHRVLRELRKSIIASLRKQGVSPRQIEELLQTDVQNLPFDIRSLLLRGVSLAGE